VGANLSRMCSVIRVAFFFSGLSALFYQVIWLRRLATVFGNTTLALSVTLTAFMAGLALGSYAFGRLGDRVTRPFRLYAWLELLIGAYGLASLALLGAVHSGYVALAQRLPFDSFWLVSFQFWASFLVLLAPTALMGGTLPVASKGVVRRLEAIAPEIGGLYAVNTFGAALGVLLVGFMVLPVLGLRLSVALAASVNLMIGIAVLALDARAAAAPVQLMPEPASASTPPASPGAPAGASPLPQLLLIILIVGFALSGFSGLALEVVWTRALSLYVGSSIYAFSAILLSVLVGIALGSLAVARLAVRRRMGLAWFAGAELGAGISTLALVFLYNLLAFAFLRLVMSFSGSYLLLLALEVGLILVCLLLPALFAGATFPILTRVYVNRTAALSRGVGFLYAANTAGCIIGAFAAGFLLIPHIGLRATALLCAGCYVVTGAAVLLANRGWSRLWAILSLTALAFALIYLPPWRPEYMSAGFFRDYVTNMAEARDYVEKQRKVLFHREGSVATVTVIAADGRSLIINGKPDASDTEGDMDTQRMVAHLPLLLAPRIQSALVVGLGSGMTAGTASLYPVRRIDCIEIEPAVADAARYFRHINHDVFSDPRFNLIIADARNYLAATPRRYDVIICEPSNPWVAGVASLFTVEHFRALRACLADDGVICQWLQVYQMAPHDVASVAASFSKVFPDATVWWVGRFHVDLALIAQKRAWKISLPRIAARISRHPPVAEDLRQAQFDSPISVISALLLGPKDLRRLAKAGTLNTDDLPWLEFYAPRNLYHHDLVDQSLDAFATCKSQPLADLVELGAADRDPSAREALGDAFLEHHADAFEQAAYLGWARDEFAAAAALAPKRPDLYEKLARVELKKRDLSSARAHLRRALELQPDRESARSLLGELPR